MGIRREKKRKKRGCFVKVIIHISLGDNGGLLPL